MLETPREISTAGTNTLLGTRTGNLPGTVVDKDGRQDNVQIPGVVVSGMGRHLLCSKKAVEKGMSTIIDSDLPRPQQGERVLPLQQRHEDSDLYSIKLTLESADKAMTMSAANDVNFWHRCMVHLNAQSLQILSNTTDNGLEHSGTFCPCDIWVQKRKHRDHPKKANHGVDAPIAQVFTRLIGPISSPTIGGHRFVSKFTDEFTKWKEVYLINEVGSCGDAKAIRTVAGHSNGPWRPTSPQRQRHRIQPENNIVSTWAYAKKLRRSRSLNKTGFQTATVGR